MAHPQLPLAFNPQLVDQPDLNAIWLHPKDFLLRLHATNPGFEFDELINKQCWIEAMESSLNMICQKFAPPSQEVAVNYIKYRVEAFAGSHYNTPAEMPQQYQQSQVEQQQLPISIIQNQQNNQARPSVIQPPFTQLPQGTKSFADLAQSRWTPKPSQSVLLPSVLVDTPKQRTAIDPADIRAQKDAEVATRQSLKPVGISKTTAEKSRTPSQQAELLRELDVEPEQYEQAAELFGGKDIKYPSGLARPECRTDEEWWADTEDFTRDLNRLNPSVTFTKVQYELAFGMAVQVHEKFLRKLSTRTGRATDALIQDAIESFRSQNIRSCAEARAQVTAQKVDELRFKLVEQIQKGQTKALNQTAKQIAVLNGDLPGVILLAARRDARRYVPPPVLRSQQPPPLQQRMDNVYSKPKTRGATAALVHEGQIVGFKAPEISAENKGRKLMEKMGWTSGSGLGREGAEGIKKPVQAIAKFSNKGLGMLDVPGEKKSKKKPIDLFAPMKFKAAGMFQIDTTTNTSVKVENITSVSAETITCRVSEDVEWW